MEVDEIIRALEACDSVLKNNGHSKAKTNNPGDRARWCSDEAIRSLDDGAFSKDKAQRWLGFCQGVIFTLGYATIEELKLMNRPIAKNHTTQTG